MIFPIWENRASKSNCVIDLGKPLIYKLAPLMLSELGRARETWKSTDSFKKFKTNLTKYNGLRGKNKNKKWNENGRTLWNVSLVKWKKIRIRSLWGSKGFFQTSLYLLAFIHLKKTKKQIKIKVTTKKKEI